MTKQLISLGTTANDGTGNTLRDAGQKLNDNFNELYRFMPGGEILTISDSTTSLDSSTLYICLLYTSPSPRDGLLSRMPSSA